MLRLLIIILKNFSCLFDYYNIGSTMLYTVERVRQNTTQVLAKLSSRQVVIVPIYLALAFR
jgi:hypothetical protein